MKETKDKKPTSRLRTICIPVELNDWLELEAKKEGRSVSNLVVRILEQAKEDRK